MAAGNRVGLEQVRLAASVIRPFIRRTPIMTSQYFNNAFGKEVLFKCEIFQKTGAFKIRGTSYAIHNILKTFNSDRKPVIVTHSSGNHAQAVALASYINKVKAIVVMPENAPQVKKNAV